MKNKTLHFIGFGDKLDNKKMEWFVLWFLSFKTSRRYLSIFPLSIFLIRSAEVFMQLDCIYPYKNYLRRFCAACYAYAQYLLHFFTNTVVPVGLTFVIV